jgi:hypothetical protein
MCGLYAPTYGTAQFYSLMNEVYEIPAGLEETTHFSFLDSARNESGLVVLGGHNYPLGHDYGEYNRLMSLARAGDVLDACDSIAKLDRFRKIYDDWYESFAAAHPNLY